MTRLPPTPIGPDFNPGQAKWCEQHNRLECTKNRSKGRGPCHMCAVRGTNACHLHAGVRKEVMIIKGEATISAWSAIGQPADGKAVDSGMAVLGMLHMSWLRAHMLGELLRRQVQDQPVEVDTEGLQGGYGSTLKGNGLIGYKFGAAGKEGHIYATNEEIRALVALEAAERDRVVKYAKTAHDMGISERLTGLAERWGDLVVGRIMLIVEGLRLTPEQEAMVPALVQAHLSSIDVGLPGLTGGE